MNNDIRAQQLEQWARQQLAEEALTWSMVSGDASFRRYFRLQSAQQSYICVDAPVSHENNPQFVKVANLLTGLNAPKVIAYDFEHGFMLLSDLGDQLLLPLLKNSENDADTLYRCAIDCIIQMQQIDSKAQLPPYDDALLMQEMELFRDWFVEKHLALTLSSVEQKMLDATFRMLSDCAQQQPQAFVHRDFHSRNIMICNGHAPGIIDFQDAVYGPISYDLLSLLRDCYIQWPESKVSEWLDYYIEQANNQLDILSPNKPLEKEEFTQWFDWMGLQRHIKVAGIFSRLNYRDGKEAYLKDLPLTLTYIVQQVEKYPQLQPFKDFMHQRVLPVMERVRSC